MSLNRFVPAFVVSAAVLLPHPSVRPVAAAAHHDVPSLPSVQPNDNRTPAGTLAGGVLTVDQPHAF